MQFRRVVLFLCLLPFLAQAQPYRLKELSLPGNPVSSLFYSVIPVPGGWASTGRAVLPDEQSYGMVIISQNNQETVYTLKAGIQCRFYCITKGSDSTILTGGYVRYNNDGPQRAFLASWDLKGRLVDSLSYVMEGENWMMMNSLLKTEDNFIYGICMVRNNDLSSPWLLKLDQHLKILQKTKLPGQLESTGVEAKIIRGENDSSFYYFVNTNDSCLIGLADHHGKILRQSTVQAPYELYYVRAATDSSGPSNPVYPEVFDIKYRDHHLYLSGTVRNRSWAGRFDEDFNLQASLITQGSLYESGGSLLFTGKQFWLSAQSSYADLPYRPSLYLLDDSLLTVKKILYTHTPSRMAFATSLPDGSILFTGAVENGETDKAAYGIIKPGEPLEKPFGSVEWESLEGPPGADATAFTIDGKGNYWLGTGSSGGVYYSSDKGDSWKKKLDGLGPMHINALSWRHDTLFARVSDMRLSERKEVNQRDRESFFYLKKGKGAWKYYSQRENYFGLNRSILEENIRKFNDYNEQFPLQKTSRVYSRLIGNYKAWGVDFKNEGFDLYTHEVSNRYGGFYPLDSNLIDLNRHFPADVFEQERNIERDGDRMILLAKSGLYFSEKGGPIHPAPVKGLVATDVRQLREGPTGDIYALVGTHEIWKLQQEEWKLLFDGNDHLHEYGKDTVVTGYDIPYMDISARDEVAFSFGGDAWKISPDGKASLLMPHGAWERSGQGSMENVNIFGAAITENGRALVVGVGSDESFKLYQKDSDTLITVIDTKSPAFCFLYTDKAGKTWFMGDSIYRLDPGGPKAYFKNDGFGFATHYASNHKGKLVLMNNGGCLIYDPKKDQWDLQNLKTPLIHDSEEYNYLSSVAIDDDDRIYTGTAPWFSIMCGYGTEGYPAGIYGYEGYLPQSLKNNINNWILSMECDKNGKVLAGTAGSGVIRSK